MGTAVAIASFFFFRGDSTRNTMAPLIATLVYQLIRAIPETKDDILIAIEHDRLIFDQSLESQLELLIIQPLLRLPRELQRLFVVFIDGLDECNDRFHQSNLIKVLGDVSCRRNIPVVFLVTSRREYQIEAAFGLDPVAELLTTILLDNSDISKTSDDIKRFLTDKFKIIKETHLHRRLLPRDWPPKSAVEEIVAKSSGQFIFASVVINYISSPRTNPARQLKLVNDIRLREASSQNPFAQLDALYQHIFLQVQALDKVLDVLAFSLLTNWVSVEAYEHVFQLAPGELEILLVDLLAVIECQSHSRDIEFHFQTRIKFLHASLPDFLQDRTRSGIYYIDVEEYRTKLLCMFLERASPVLPPTSRQIPRASAQETSRLLAICNLFSAGNIKTRRERLYHAVMQFKFTLYSREMAENISAQECYTSILHYLDQQQFEDQGQANRHVSELFAPGYVKFGIHSYNWTSEDWAPGQGGWILWRQGHYERAPERPSSFMERLWKAL
ncbi:hypothetical protein BJ912DRAFT_150531 [Pholiota molesta]|nr:hypothetical protein BJ912DRAFT_150531 [Pholiota molesta]